MAQESALQTPANYIRAIGTVTPWAWVTLLYLHDTALVQTHEGLRLSLIHGLLPTDVERPEAAKARVV